MENKLVIFTLLLIIIGLALSNIFLIRSKRKVVEEYRNLKNAYRDFFCILDTVTNYLYRRDFKSLNRILYSKEVENNSDAMRYIFLRALGDFLFLNGIFEIGRINGFILTIEPYNNTLTIRKNNVYAQSFNYLNYSDLNELFKEIRLNYETFLSFEKSMLYEAGPLPDLQNVTLEEQNSQAEIITLNGYQAAALTTAIFKEDYKIIYPALKLAGEAGEVAEKVGKVLRDDDGVFSPEKKQDLKKELGDVLWYIAALSNSLGYCLSDVATENIRKLKSRKERGVIHGSGDNR